MSYYAVFGDIHPSMMVRVDEAEAKTIQTKLAIGIKPEDIRLLNKIRDGSRNLGTQDYLILNDTEYAIISKGQYLCLERLDNDYF
ncbi:hypothetical protein OXC43_gp76 [Klebsiella phage vB_KpP_FBKp27]|uniref:Uncharacterized protein n=1 Tax=Klebsiella phage vB_KpP_FBKp27 TaxID=2801837 RepID=A0A7U0GAL2_9CAUD|nr:hypothetical protein OXC43_gp76 [Klebsiella phage vB_KpP_FBKp27]QQV91666.1 hypothetical protein vBKpPFBKp27_043 [Klebsiella phage vB_KpP_FBKp27]